MLVGYAVKLISIIALYIYMYLENKHRDRMAADGEIPGDGDRDAVENGMLVGSSIQRYYFSIYRRSVSNPSVSSC